MNQSVVQRTRRSFRRGADPSSAVTTGQWQFIRKEGTMRILMAVAFLASTAIAQAAPLGVGGTLFPAPGEPDPVGASLVIGSGALPFVSPNFSGTLTSNIYNNDSTNPFGPAALTFTYLLTNDNTSVNSLARLTVNGYLGFSTDASYQVPAAGVIPALIDRQSADVVGFSFVGPPLGQGVIMAGQRSALLVIQTNATTYGVTLASIQDGTIAQVPTYSPSPEPAAMGLTAIGLLTVARRRRK